MEKIRTLIWFLRRPNLYLQLIYQLRQSLFPHPKEATRQKSTDWCNDVAMGTNEALKELSGFDNYQKVEELYAAEFKSAREIQEKLPLKMGGAGNYDLLYHLSAFMKPRIVVETGVAYGWSTMAILLAIEKSGTGKLMSVDMPYAKLGNESFVGCIIPNRLKKHWSLFRSPDRQGLRKVLKSVSEIDICHYDSDKSYRGRMWAYPRLWKKLRKGGIFLSDDINDNIAFKEFSQIVGVTPVVVRWNEQFVGILAKN